MTVSIDDFWKLAATSGVLSTEQCRTLAGAFAAVHSEQVPPNVRDLAAWVVKHKALTPYQAKVLAAGRPGPFVFGPIVITDRIEKGRLARLHRATYQGKARVMLVFLAQLSEDARDYRALVELAQQAAKINNPHVTRTFRAVGQGSSPFIVVERLLGNSLAEILAHQKLKRRRACQVGMQAALGLVGLAGDQQVHDCVCPQNIWIDAEGTARLMQFPLVPAPWQRQRLEPPLVDYVAPELTAPGASATAASDIYSLGCTLFELFTQRVPFPGGTPRDKILRHREETPPRVDELNPRIHEDIAELVSDMLSKDPLLRPQSAGDVAHVLARFATEAEGRAAQPPKVDGDKPRHGFGAWKAPDWEAPPPQASAPLPRGIAVPRPADPEAARPQPADSEPIIAEPTAAEALENAVESPANQAQTTTDPEVPAAMPVDEPREPADDAADARPEAVEEAPSIVIHTDDADRAAPTEFAIVTEPTDSGSSTAPTARRKKSALTPVRVAVAVTSVLVLVVAVVALLMLGGSSDTATPHAPDVGTTPTPADAALGEPALPVSADANAPPAKQASEEQVPDDGTMLWASPTAGDPIEPAYLPNGAQVILVLRVADLLATAEGPKLLAALGPAGPESAERLRNTLGVDLAQIEQLIVAVAPDEALEPQTAYVMRLASDVPEKDLFAAWGRPRTALAGSTRYYRGDTLAYYLPESGAGRTVIVAPPELMEQILEFGGQPLLRRGIESLLQHSDARRQINLFFTPSYLLTDGRGLLAGHLAELAEPLETFFTHDIEAVLASAHVGDELFVELRAVAPLELPPLELAEVLQTRWQRVPDRVETYVAALNAQPHGRLLILRFPRMLQLARDFTRSGIDGGQAVLRAYLPAHAAHNLLMGADLTLLEAAGVDAAPSTAAAPATTRSAADALGQKISLAFPREALDRAMEVFAEEVGVPVVILGSDLQLEGITKNQSLNNVDQRDQPADDVLRLLLKLANPDGKLVYVIKPDDQGVETVWITTRAAADKRGDALPPGF